MNEKTLKFDNTRVNKKEFHKSKQPIDLGLVNVDQVVMSFVIKDDYVLDKYNEIWDKIKETLNIKFHSMPVYHEKYIKARVREFNGAIKINFLGNKIPNAFCMHYTCIVCITIDSVTRVEKKNYPQVYLEERKHRIKSW